MDLFVEELCWRAVIFTITIIQYLPDSILSFIKSPQSPSGMMLHRAYFMPLCTSTSSRPALAAELGI